MVELLVRGRFIELPDATLRQHVGNALSITIPLSPERLRRVRRGAQAEDWDGAIFCVDGEECEPAMGSGEGPKSVTVTVWVL